MSVWLQPAAVLMLLVTTGGVASAQDSLTTARDLYAEASYEEALLLLNRLRGNAERIDEARAIEQYRAFCLLALGRSADAEQAIEAVIVAEPSYQPLESEASPRVRAAFADVRRRTLPAIAQQRYVRAKAAFDSKDFAGAVAGFKGVLEVLAEPEIAAAANEPPLSDLRTLAAGFHDLSATAAAPPPPPPPPAPEPEPPPPPPQPDPTLPPRVYGPGDPEVVAPAIVRQWLPPFPIRSAMTPPQGAIEVVIDENGAVEAAVMKAPLDPAYNRQLLAAARTWLYKPATVNGIPVKYRKTIQITVKR